jgi:hypothetical protein
VSAQSRFAVGFGHRTSKGLRESPSVGPAAEEESPVSRSVQWVNPNPVSSKGISTAIREPVTLVMARMRWSHRGRFVSIVDLEHALQFRESFPGLRLSVEASEARQHFRSGIPREFIEGLGIIRFRVMAKTLYPHRADIAPCCCCLRTLINIHGFLLVNGRPVVFSAAAPSPVLWRVPHTRSGAAGIACP